MQRKFFLTIAAVLTVAALSAQQRIPRRATFLGGGSPDRGKCTIEVVVDGAVEIEIRGDSAVMRNLSGNPPSWRRFECTGALPGRPAEFRFAGVDGRGRQTLIQDPRNGGVAVVRIEDSKGGSEGYTFDIFWGGWSGQGRVMPGGPPARAGRFSAEHAIRVCQESVRQQAAQRYGTSRVEIRDTRIDDNPGRNDWVVGTIQVGRDVTRFSCSVDFDSGRVRSAQIDEMPRAVIPPPMVRDSSDIAVNSCRRAVEARLRRDRYRDINITRINLDDRPGRNDWVLGTARADGNPFEFSCSVNLRSGEVRSVDVRPRR